MNDETPESATGGELAVYKGAGGGMRVDVRLDRETVWLTQRQMVEVFDSTPENVLMHLLDHGFDGDIRYRTKAGTLDGIESEESADPARLHDAGATAMYPAVLHHGLEGGCRPHVVWPFGHDIDVAVDDQGASTGGGAAHRADADPGIVVSVQFRRISRQVANVLVPDLPAIDGESPCRQGAGDESCGPLTEGRRTRSSVKTTCSPKPASMAASSRLPVSLSIRCFLPVSPRVCAAPHPASPDRACRLRRAPWPA